ncbi:hypothetical protein LINGRAHAP2_LOCUS23092, partial [Linum grandiflorum]
WTETRNQKPLFSPLRISTYKTQFHLPFEGSNDVRSPSNLKGSLGRV